MLITSFKQGDAQLRVLLVPFSVPRSRGRWLRGRPSRRVLLRPGHLREGRHRQEGGKGEGEGQRQGRGLWEGGGLEGMKTREN